MKAHERTAGLMKIEQLELFTKKLNVPHREASALFDKYKVWQFIDDAYEGLHVQGSTATFEDIRQYLHHQGYRLEI